ncbi:hemerythrin domain-containing protein [Nitrosomonas aestuarii]|uniref:hemerythrin domain-containing protein n=1 Tax=Nitrosomonas aestuarii TaxID=52441 RepID=UPI000D30E096|nr:hemerythrin domain-containing protein [Nitrosomonas aestuarii]PTN13174.1 hemerythrin HHE cation binding domain-containing protein [Nitrosomonas aestuarii]
MKRAAALKALSMDHHYGLVLARKAKMAASGEKTQNSEKQQIWTELLAHAKSVLISHFVIEESYLAAALKALNDPNVDQLVDQLYAEHETLRQLLSPNTVRDTANLKMLGELLEQHIRFEERELFEIAQMKLDDQTLQTIAAACSTKHN